MLSFFDPEQFKHESKFLLFYVVSKAISEVAESGRVKWKLVLHNFLLHYIFY